MSRRLAREAVFKALFQVDVGDIYPGKALKYALEELQLKKEEISFVEELFEGAIKEIENLNRLITDNLVRWTLERIASVDRCILRMALYEILHMPNIPPAVSINEAVELGKEYGDVDSSSFINGVLDGVVKEKEQKQEKEQEQAREQEQKKDDKNDDIIKDKTTEEETPDNKHFQERGNKR